MINDLLFEVFDMFRFERDFQKKTWNSESYYLKQLQWMNFHNLLASNFNMGPIELWLYVSFLNSVKDIKFPDFKWLSIHSFYQLQFLISDCMIFNELSILNFDMGPTALS